MAARLTSLNLKALGEELAGASADIGIFTDVDGTLSEIREHPDLATVSSEMTAALTELNHLYRLVVIVSGRRAQDVQKMVGEPDLLYLGNHGIESRHKDKTIQNLDLEETRSRLVLIKSELESELAGDQGVFVEDKELVLAIHYRRCPHEEVKKRIKSLAAKLAAEHGFLAQNGRQVTEIRPKSADKGRAILELARQHNIKLVIYAGDDATDVDAFKALKNASSRGDLRSVCLAVVHDESPVDIKDSADYWVESTDEVRKFFVWLAKIQA